jgi:hypothetical protein
MLYSVEQQVMLDAMGLRLYVPIAAQAPEVCSTRDHSTLFGKVL